MLNDSLTDILAVWDASERMAASNEPALLAAMTSQLERFKQGLDTISVELDRPKPTFGRYSPLLGTNLFPMRLPPELRQQAEALYLRIWHNRGMLKHSVEEGLLAAVGFTADPASLPFWHEVVGLSRVGDGFARHRRALAVAGIAYTSLRHPASTALEALRALTAHALPQVRGDAVEALALVSTDVQGNIDPSAVEILRRVATTDPAFEPRLIARRWLLMANALPPTFAKDDVIAFEVKLGVASRTIELGAEQTLDDLHGAIQRAFGWDSDHLHAFYLTGDRRDPRFTTPREDDDAFADVPLGALGFPAGHRFTYLFDFGDNNLFKIRVVGTSKSAHGAKYPRVIEKKGKSPPQYGNW
jgi:hypothetical protein